MTTELEPVLGTPVDEDVQLGEPVEPIVLTKEKKKKDKKEKDKKGGKKDKKDNKKKGKKKPSDVITRDLDQEKFNPVSNPDFVDPSKEEKWVISTNKELPAVVEKKLDVSPVTPTERQGFMATKYFPTEGYTHLDPSKSDNLYSAFNQLQKKTQQQTQQQRPTHLKDGIKVLLYARASWSYNAQIPSELTFNANDTFAVIKQQADGWWYAELLDNERRARGLIPGNYMIPC